MGKKPSIHANDKARVFNPTASSLVCQKFQPQRWLNFDSVIVPDMRVWCVHVDHEWGYRKWDSRCKNYTAVWTRGVEWWWLLSDDGTPQYSLLACLHTFPFFHVFQPLDIYGLQYWLFNANIYYMHCGNQLEISAILNELEDFVLLLKVTGHP